jgi:hypothetical protein
MTDDPTNQRRRDHDDFTERGGWQKEVKPPKADAQPPGPQPKQQASTSSDAHKDVDSDE